MKYIGIYSSHKALAKKSDKFFDSDMIKHWTNYQLFVGMNYLDIIKQRRINDKFNEILEQAELMCKAWAVDDGFLNDKSFAKWYLTTYHSEVTETTTEGINSNNITIGIIDAS